MKDINMKGRKQLFGAVLALSLLLGGCAAPQESPSEEDYTADIAAYQARIAELEAELLALKEQYYIATMQPTTPEDTQPTTPEPEPGAACFHYRATEGAVFVTGFSGSAAMVTLPESVEGLPIRGIDDRAFEGADFATVTLPTSLTRIGWFAFYECKHLVELYIPAEVTEIGYGAFDGCTGLRIVTPTGSYASKYAKSYGIPCTEQ